MHGQPAGKLANIIVKGVTRIKVGRREFRLKPHRKIVIGQKLVEVGCVVDAKDFTSGRFFLVTLVLLFLKYKSNKTNFKYSLSRLSL